MTQRERIIIWTNGIETKEQRTLWTMKNRQQATKEEQKFIDCGYEATEIKFEEVGR
jgi:hypothetical protein